MSLVPYSSANGRRKVRCILNLSAKISSATVSQPRCWSVNGIVDSRPVHPDKQIF